MDEQSHSLSCFLGRDFFISRAGADKAFAIWIGKLISAQGKSYILQDEDFGAEIFTNAMHRALTSGARIIALYSQAYLESPHCRREALEALNDDPFNERQRLIPFRIEPCAPAGMLNVTYVDLLEERRQPDGAALALRILRALGFANPQIEGLPPPPQGVLSPRTRIVHPLIRGARADFAVREKLMARLANSMRGLAKPIAAPINSEYVVSAVAGMGGVGKTVLARKFAHRHADKYCGVWWVEAEKHGRLLAGLAELGAELSAAIKGKAQESEEQAARATLDLIERANYAKPFLLIYDNVGKPGDIEWWIPRAGADVLITTRWTEWGGVADQIDVGVFEREEAIDFLCQRAGRPSDHEEAGQLAEALGYLPLALDHAGSLCRSGRRTSFKEYRETLGRQRLQWKPSKGAAFGDYPESVWGSLSLALERVIAGDPIANIDACPEAKTVIGVAALMAPTPIPISLFSQHRISSFDFDAAIRALSGVSLLSVVENESGDATLTVHRLVQAVMRDKLGEDRSKDKILELAVELLCSIIPQQPSDFVTWKACKALAPHALEILKLARKLKKNYLQIGIIAFNVAQYLQAVANYSQVESLLKQSLSILEKSSGAKHPHTAAVLYELARLYQTQGRYAEVEPLLNRSLAILKKRVNKRHPYTSTVLHQLACLYQEQGRYDEAEPLLKRSLAMDEKTVGVDHPSISATLHELARLYLALGRYAEAEPLLKRSLEIKEKAFGRTHPSMSAALLITAVLYRVRGRYAEAENLLKQSLMIDLETFDEEHPYTSVTLHELAQLYQVQGRYAEARPLLERSLRIRLRMLGPDHPCIGQSLDLVALCELGVGNLVRAESAAIEALSHRKARLFSSNPEIAHSLWTLARVMIGQGRSKEAEDVLGQAIDILQGKVSENHVWLRGARNTLAKLSDHTSPIGTDDSS